MEYNIQYETEDITFVEGDPINFSWQAKQWNEITEVWDLYDLTGLQVDVHVKTKQGTVIKHWSSAGVGPEITIATSTLNVTTTAFDDIGAFYYDVQVLTEGTFRRGKIFVVKEITT